MSVLKDGLGDHRFVILIPPIDAPKRYTYTIFTNMRQESERHLNLIPNSSKHVSQGFIYRVRSTLDIRHNGDCVHEVSKEEPGWALEPLEFFQTTVPGVMVLPRRLV